MSGDISDSAKIGIGVLLLCFLIGIVFNVFTMVRSTATKGTNQLQGSMNQMVDATYAAYDNETVFGTSVLNAIATYGQDKMCIVVDNNKNTGNTITLYKPESPVQTNSSQAHVTGKAYYYGYPLKDKPVASNTVSFYTAVLDTQETRVLDSSHTKSLGDTAVYVNTQNRYSANLIKDDSGLIIGVYFKLQAS